MPLSKYMKIIYVFATVFGAIMMFCMVMTLSGRVMNPENGFAVDAVGRVYIGDTKKIYVYEQGVCIDEIYPQTNRTYIFTIMDGDTILLSTASHVLTMDLTGVVLSETEDTRTTVYRRLSAQKDTFTANDGTIIPK